MATLWAEGFADQTVSNYSSDYSVASTTSVIAGLAGRFPGSSAIEFRGNNNNWRRSLGVSRGTVFASFAHRLTGLSGTVANNSFFRFCEGATVHVALAFVRISGDMVITRGDAGTILGTIPAASLPPVGNWSFYQVRVVIHDTAGSVEIRDGNNNVLINISGANTRNGGGGAVDTIAISNLATSTGLVFQLTDLHIWDETGLGCTTWTGDTRVDYLRPNGAGDTTQFTPSAGANWETVDDVTWSSADYVESDVVGNRDLYQFTNLPHNPLNVFGVLQTAAAEKMDAGVRGLVPVAKSGPTVSVGTSVPLLLGSVVRVCRPLDVDPNTSTAWTPAGVNAAQFGYDVGA